MMIPDTAPRKRPLSGFAVVTGEVVIQLVIPPRTTLIESPPKAAVTLAAVRVATAFRIGCAASPGRIIAEPVMGRARQRPWSSREDEMYLIRERFFRLGEDSDITDEQGRPVLQVDGKVLTLHDRLILRDPNGQEVAQVHRKLVALRPTYEVSVGGREVAEVRKRLFTPFGDRFTIDLPGPDDLEMTGDLLDHEFTIRRGDQTVATISKRWFSMRDTYAVDVAAGQDDLLILACVLALDLAEDRERRQD